MRVLLMILLTAPFTRLLACSCAGPGTPCVAAGRAAAVFTGTVLDIADRQPPAPRATGSPGIGSGNRGRAGAPVLPFPLSKRVVRMQVAEVLSGIAPGQQQIEILTGMGGGDCGYAFQTGVGYVVYAYKNAEGRLETGICNRTRPLAQAAEDLEYFRATAGKPETSDLRVHTGFADVPGKPGATIVAARAGLRYTAVTNAAGEAVFPGLAPGEYTIHAAADGDLPDDPKVQVNPRGCVDVALFRALRINGRIMTKSGLPAVRVEIQLRTTQNTPWESRTTDADGRYEIRIVRPGQYYLGINLNRSPTRDTPYPRWFHPGTEDPVTATVIDFSGKAEVRTYDLILPDPQPERTIEGVVLQTDGHPMPRAVVSVRDGSQSIVAQAMADQNGRFAVQVFAGIAYRLHAIGRGKTPADAASAEPVDIPADTSPVSLRLILTQPGIVR